MTFFRRKSPLAGLACVSIDAERAYSVRIVRQAQHKPVFVACDSLNLSSDPGVADSALKKWARGIGLERIPCITVLEAKHYRLLTAEAPNVPNEELRAALRWKIKDLIDFPIQEATIDVFDIPGAQAVANGRPVYVVAARNEDIRHRVAMLTAAKVNLQFIDIIEMSLRNIAGLLAEDEAGVAILSLSSNSGLITLTKQSKLYLTRSLNVGLDNMIHPQLSAGAFNQVALELQRSLDYFESHFRQPAIRHVFIAPQETPVPGLVEFLQTNLGLSAAFINFETLLECPSQLPRGWQTRHCIAIGAALRQEMAA